MLDILHLARYFEIYELDLGIFLVPKINFSFQYFDLNVIVIDYSIYYDDALFFSRAISFLSIAISSSRFFNLSS